jgi:hypothetical protein
LRFHDFLLEKSGELEQLFGLEVFSNRRIRHNTEDHLQVTAQAWKGFSKVCWRPLESWQNPGFIEEMVRGFLDFAEKVTPLVEECFGGLEIKVL